MIQPVFMLLAASYFFSAEGVERIDTQVIQGGVNSCPSDELRDAARTNASNAVRNILQGLGLVPECGEGVWEQVGYLDMSDSEQSCPSPWIEFSDPQRSCGQSVGGICDAVLFPVAGRSYNRVCGRVTGLCTRTIDAFGYRYFEHTIDQVYVEGVSITHSSPRQHIWTFAAGYGEDVIRCPCDSQDREQAPLPPSFVGDNYFCDGNYNGAVWDGMDCTTNCCTFNSPPWFSVSIPAPTSDDIEVRLCTDESRGNEAVYISFLQLYIQ